MDIYTLEELRKMNQIDGSKKLVFLNQLIEQKNIDGFDLIAELDDIEEDLQSS